jgi:hypothetical protein
MQLNGWLIPLRAFREMHGEEGGEVSAGAADGDRGRVGNTRPAPGLSERGTQ